MKPGKHEFRHQFCWVGVVCFLDQDLTNVGTTTLMKKWLNIFLGNVILSFFHDRAFSLTEDSGNGKSSARKKVKSV